MAGTDQGKSVDSTGVSDKTEKIRDLNDSFRQGSTGGVIHITVGVHDLGVKALNEIVCSIAAFASFGPENDPYGEHDFGSIDHRGFKVFWKIDYFDRDLIYGSPDPAEPSVTTRVMTIMLAEEY